MVQEFFSRGVSTGTYYMDTSIHRNPLGALGGCSSPECQDGQGWRVSRGQRLVLGHTRSSLVCHRQVTSPLPHRV